MTGPAKRKRPGVIRPEATRVHVYNEGLCVYVWDDAHAPMLRKMLESREYRPCSPKQDFFNNVSAGKFGREVARLGLAAVYTLDQDDEVEVEVCVGPPLTDDELAIACWLPPQRANLHIPSGRLRIDTPNTMPLDPDKKHDRGGMVEVSPGEFTLTLYRIDWGNLKRTGKRYKGPQEVIVLTPRASSSMNTSASPILKYNARGPRTPDRVKARANKAAFKCKLAFLGYWERYGVNLTRASVAEVGLKPGARLRFRADKFLLDALYLGDMTIADFTRFAGGEYVEQITRPHSEFALSEWSILLGGAMERLAFTRIKAKKCVPERLMDVWTPAEALVLPETVEIPQPAVAEPAVTRKGVIHGNVTYTSPEEVVLNVTAEHLNAIGANYGDLLTLNSEGSPPRGLLYGQSVDDRSRYMVVTAELIKIIENYFLQIAAREPRNCFFTLGGKGRPKVYSGSLPVHRLDDENGWPLVGLLLPPVGGGAPDVLRLTPFLLNGDASRETWTADLSPGAKILIKKRARTVGR